MSARTAHVHVILEVRRQRLPIAGVDNSDVALRRQTPKGRRIFLPNGAVNNRLPGGMAKRA